MIGNIQANRHRVGEKLNLKQNTNSLIKLRLDNQEELVAELGAAYLCHLTGIQDAIIDNSAAYIKNRIGKFEEDKKMLLIASSMAQKAVDYILEHQSGESSWIKTRTGNQLTEAD